MNGHLRESPSNRARASFWLLAFMLLLSPLYLSSKPPLAVMALELLSLLGLLVLGWGGSNDMHSLHTYERWVLWALLLVPALYLTPFPAGVRLLLPGQGDYYAALQAVGADGWVSVSLDTASTLKALAYLLIPVVVFALTRALRARALRKLVGLFLFVAAIQAGIGLIQFGVAADAQSFWHFGEPPGHNARGTWSSRNNFAGFLNIALMVAIAFFMATLGRHKQQMGDESFRDRLVYWSTWQGHRAFVYGFMVLLLLTAIVFTRSRMGIMTSMLGVLLATVFFARRIGGDNAYGLTGTILAGVLGVGTTIGLGPVLARFSQADPLADGRSYIFEGAFQGIGHFFPLGSGPGTFVEVFPRFQAWEMATLTINRAHNSYLEWLFTMGMPAAVLIAVLLFLYARQWFRLGDTWSEFRFVQTGAGLGCLLTLVHELVDYNLFVPANVVVFAFMAGLFFHPHRDQPTVKARAKSASPVDAMRARVVLPVVDSADNPFSEKATENG